MCSTQRNRVHIIAPKCLFFTTYWNILSVAMCSFRNWRKLNRLHICTSTRSHACTHTRTHTRTYTYTGTQRDEFHCCRSDGKLKWIINVYHDNFILVLETGVLWHKISWTSCLHTYTQTYTHIGQIIPMGTFLPKKKTALDEINLKRPRRFLLCWHILHCDVILTQLKQHDILTKVNNGFSAGILKKRVNWLKTFLFSFWQWWKLFCANLNGKNVCN